MQERRRKKTNVNESTDDEWIVVKTKLAEEKDGLTHVHGEGVRKGEIEEMLEENVRQCDKPIHGKRENLPK